MAEAGLFIGWGNPVRGRERNAMDVFGEAVALWTKLQLDGDIESFEIAFLEPHGGDLDGYFLLRGDPEKVAGVRVSDGFLRVIERAALVVERLGVVGATLGAGIEQAMNRYEQHIAELT